MSNTMSKQEKIIQFLALGLIFIILPAGSWYYLNEGFKYRKGILEELDQNLGKIPTFQLNNQNGQTITNEDLSGRVVIANFLSLANKANAPAYMKQLYQVQDQFDKRDDILFLTFTEADSRDQVASYFQGLEVKRNKNQWHFLSGSEEDLTGIEESLALPATYQSGFADNATIMIADTSQVIRQLYDFRQETAVKKLIHHIAVLMPAGTKKRELRDKK